MQIRMKIGPQAGKIIDLPYASARALVEVNQADDIYDQMRLPKAKVTRIDSVSFEGKKIPNEIISASLDGESIPVEASIPKKKRK